MWLIHFITSQTRYIYKTALMFALLVVAFLFFRDNGWQQVKRKIRDLFRQGWLVVFLLYAAYLLTATVVGRYQKNPYHLVFSGFGIDFQDLSNNTDLINNILLYIPYSFLFLQAFKPEHPLKKALLISLATSAFLELSQLIGWLGSFQLADMLHNVIGGLVGYGIWYIWKKVLAWYFGK